jgi:hypothetical protein
MSHDVSSLRLSPLSHGRPQILKLSSRPLEQENRDIICFPIPIGSTFRENIDPTAWNYKSKLPTYSAKALERGFEGTNSQKHPLWLLSSLVHVVDTDFSELLPSQDAGTAALPVQEKRGKCQPVRYVRAFGGCEVTRILNCISLCASII